MAEPEIRGRFLPSRVYSRWLWTVRFGLMVVPLLVFLSGGLILYLTPNEYQSVVLFEVEDGPEPDEVVALVRSNEVISRTEGLLGLNERLNLDRETAARELLSGVRVYAEKRTGMVRLEVTHRNKEIAKEVAAELPPQLMAYLLENVESVKVGKIRDWDSLILEARDEAEDRAVVLAKLERVHGSEPGGAERAKVERARRASILSDGEVERLSAMKFSALAAGINEKPHLLIHTAPKISQTPVNPKMKGELNELAVTSLIAGLICALSLPYLMELAFPPRIGRVRKEEPVIDL